MKMGEFLPYRIPLNLVRIANLSHLQNVNAHIMIHNFYYRNCTSLKIEDNGDCEVQAHNMMSVNVSTHSFPFTAIFSSP